MSDKTSIYESLYQAMQDSALDKWAEQLPAQLDVLSAESHGDYDRWNTALTQLPEAVQCDVDLTADNLQTNTSIPIDTAQLEKSLKLLSPWRKGPYQINDLLIDTEWHSDWKWNRIKEHLSPLKNRVVLDIGCGNGYHCWRMHGEGARLVIGIDPSWLFWMQFQAIKHFIGEKPVYLLPMGIEGLPDNLAAFDTVFSMGVFYHRRSPVDHLLQLKNTLRMGGELVLETLIIEGSKGESLVPDDRYAKMRNVWFLPTVDTMTQWLQRCGFKEIKVVDVNQTSTDEQRSTSWMPYESLKDYLDPEDNNKTIEGYPAPLRATFIAQKP
ncbi:MAG: tRNA 5-methoxyuridine(34)/uridine 5-oxyacetic acid(34) synthase CmoB [gamma proteobacterium symbiont of Lucinoma myriamae]|nr:tRNA 5-methoxyuridine(34)/uridine 5-oxyacetic acid(34) synthase CmoB [gamma proteobacterium symbiont of Lucinoma myriamae]MCU7819102.1 tRNA 5-methoxyuridine(34)/uridine 5-oxyacetic acid(34) synthase CmoB [gamma proteobacterium symbiont of Lucinoma myriamae]MCU7831984.1 tRNA 5-methoxyuridine(34)/uridine 5-oxyacetic acid(34) synthase CmoB [gamma proteobacterium symbiont of Lucinoma myriamae]